MLEKNHRWCTLTVIQAAQRAESQWTRAKKNIMVIHITSLLISLRESKRSTKAQRRDWWSRSTNVGIKIAAVRGNKSADQGEKNRITTLQFYCDSWIYVRYGTNQKFSENDIFWGGKNKLKLKTESCCFNTMFLIYNSKNMVDIIAGWATPVHSSKPNAALQLLQRRAVHAFNRKSHLCVCCTCTRPHHGCSISCAALI